MAKLIEVTALRDFSNTLMGNVTTGQKIMITPDRKRVWVAQGLVAAEEINISKMSKKQLAEFTLKRFDIELDTKPKIEAVRADVQALIDCID